MNFNEYQQLAARTMPKLTDDEMTMHALHGMAGEIGELHSVYQKKYQGHYLSCSGVKKELGDLLWFIAEYCTSMGWEFDEIAELNIEKLKARYPNGFEVEKSINRAKGDK